MDRFKVVHFRIDEILYDPADAARALEKACMRMNRQWRVTGCCDVGNGLLIFPVESTGSERPVRYCFSKLPDCTLENISSDLQIRFMHGMSLIGSFRCGDDLWGLFIRV